MCWKQWVWASSPSKVGLSFDSNFWLCGWLGLYLCLSLFVLLYLWTRMQIHYFFDYEYFHIPLQLWRYNLVKPNHKLYLPLWNKNCYNFDLILVRIMSSFWLGILSSETLAHYFGALISFVFAFLWWSLSTIISSTTANHTSNARKFICYTWCLLFTISKWQILKCFGGRINSYLQIKKIKKANFSTHDWSMH